MFYIRALLQASLYTVLLIGSTAQAATEPALFADPENISLSKPVNAKTGEYYTISSGTGFFVDNQHIITNNHVIKNCRDIKIRGAVKPSKATLVAQDETNDLALLRSDEMVWDIAPLRLNENITPGDKVTVIGYPLQHGATGNYLVTQGTITDLHEPVHGNTRILFTDAVERGNSGGPLIDTDGNVLGVVVGKMNFYPVNIESGSIGPEKPLKIASVAISLPTLKNFLNQHRIRYLSRPSGRMFSYRKVEDRAKNYTVNIHCVQQE